MNIITDEQRIDVVLTRGVEAVLPGSTELKKLLLSGRSLRLYTGIDPTGPTLHIGHGSTLLKLKDFQDLGHQIILLIGDFTAMIGDPTDKSKARVQLSESQVKENLADYLSQAGKVLDLERVEVRYNSEWYSDMTLAKVLELSSEFTVSQMMERDMFQERVRAGEPTYIHELLYPMLQGYDSVMLDVDLEVGGNDQTFNMLAGRTLLKRHAKEKYVMALKLLVDPTGKKMGKTEGNMVTLADEPSDMYGKIMSWPDSLVPLAFEICTRTEVASSTNPRDDKMRLAREIVLMYHGSEAAEAAEKQFVETFQKGGIPEDLPTVQVETGSLLIDAAVGQGIVDSKSEYRRLLGEGAISIAESGEKITDPQYIVTTPAIYRIGKHRFLKVTLN